MIQENKSELYESLKKDREYVLAEEVILNEISTKVRRQTERFRIEKKLVENGRVVVEQWSANNTAWINSADIHYYKDYYTFKGFECSLTKLFNSGKLRLIITF